MSPVDRVAILHRRGDQQLQPSIATDQVGGSERIRVFDLQRSDGLICTYDRRRDGDCDKDRHQAYRNRFRRQQPH